MTFDSQYYANRKQEIINEYNQLVAETYSEIERFVVKKAEKTKVLQAKLQEIESQEKSSQENEAKKDTPKGKAAKPAKTE